MSTTFSHKVRNCLEFTNENQIELPFVATLKYDGVRAFYYPGAKTLVSRQNKPIYGMDHIIQGLKEFYWPVDMELTVPDLQFNEISGIVRNNNNTPEVIAHIIDIVRPGPLLNRLMYARTLSMSSTDVSGIPFWHISSWDDYYRLYAIALDMGFEGMVLKTEDHEYKNARTKDWLRHVPIHSEDCTIADVYEGKGKMSGMLGGFIINFKGLECKVGTLKDIDYAKRIEIWQNAEDYIGQVIEVQFKNLQPSGKPRQPRMKGFRWDK